MSARMESRRGRMISRKRLQSRTWGWASEEGIQSELGQEVVRQKRSLQQNECVSTRKNRQNRKRAAILELRSECGIFNVFSNNNNGGEKGGRTDVKILCFEK